MKYVDTKVVFREVPDEVTLAINISNCPVKCPGCHSSYLAQDIGEPLDFDVLKKLIDNNPGITCVSFMGGDAQRELVGEFSRKLKQCYPGLKTCWYSGRDLEQAKINFDTLDFVKVGPFIDEYGPLDSPTTNQRFYAISHNGKESELIDWTHRFQKTTL